MSTPTPNWINRLLLGLAGLSLVLAWANLATIGTTDPWYRNLDMNMQNTADALAINTRLAPNLIDQPGVPMKCLLALDFRLRHYAGLLPVWNLKKFGDSADPLREIPPLIRVGRMHSRILVLGFILCAAALAYRVTGQASAAGLTVILLSGSSALLFHGLLTRPELLCVLFGNVLALLCAWCGTTTRSWLGNHLWLLLAGLLCGFAALEKLPGVCYLALCYGWCWLAALTAEKADPAPQEVAGFWRGLLPAAGGAALLWLLYILTPTEQDDLGTVVVLRLRVAAVAIGVLPLLTLWPGRQPAWRFLVARSRELALLGGGAFSALPLGYLLLRTFLPEPVAQDYISRTLHLLVDPAPMMKILAANPQPGGAFLTFVRQDAFLFFGTPALVAGLAFIRGIPGRFKAFLVLLLACALGLTLVLSKRNFLAQYSLFAQVPFLLVWSLGLPQLAAWATDRLPTARRRAALALAAVVLAAFLLTAQRRTYLKYTNYQDDAALPVNNFSLIFLFDHDAHTATYLRIMRQHYSDREQFSHSLEKYLSDPKNRY